MADILEIDEIDRSILRFLSENSRMSMQEMSRLSGIPDATIQFRLKRLKANGIIERFTIQVDPDAIGYSVMAVVLVQTEADKHDDTKVALTKLPQITEVYGVLGEYDLLIKVYSSSLEDLNALINDKIRTIEGIEDLLEIVVVERVKDESHPVFHD
ncbi:MAG: Lrp/AsnC family transcriptional regulator [Methanotrichaceae archaeon]|nr:Lrp/AsnC family transcriptional regulator [Methanotrichaceae archaeon]